LHIDIIVAIDVENEAETIPHQAKFNIATIRYLLLYIISTDYDHIILETFKKRITINMSTQIPARAFRAE